MTLEEEVKELRRRIDNLEVTIKSLEFIKEKHYGNKPCMRRIEWPLIRCDHCGQIHHFDIGCDTPIIG